MGDGKDKIDTFFDWVDKGVDKYIDKMSQVQTPDKAAKADDEFQREQRSAEVPPPNRQLSAQSEADITIIDDDDSEVILKALKAAAGLWRQHSTSSALPERTRNIALANCASAETIADDIREKLSRGYHFTLRK